MVRIFLDSADSGAIERYCNLGVIDGVTINPTLLRKASGKPEAIVKRIISIMGSKEVHIQVTETDPKKVHEQASRIGALGDNVVIKIPCLLLYSAIIRQLVDQGYKINITLVFSVTQAVVMSNLGVQYVSPFVGRLVDHGEDGVLVVNQMVHMMNGYGYKTAVLAASIRNKEQMVGVIGAGAPVVTVSLELLSDFFDHQLTRDGLDRFSKDWDAIKGERFP